ncbi:MAG: presenilin family intramembrane aspartyl protease, partial [Candidatus Woesearchaeota archaeon]
HGLKIIIFLMLLFFGAQIIGLYLLNASIVSVEKNEQGIIEINYTEPPTGRPEIDKNSIQPFTYVFFMIILGTLILLFIIKMRLFKIWKAWFFLAIMLSLFIVMSVIISNSILALIISIILTFLKLYKPNIIIHNLTELFIYSAITLILVPIFNIQLAFLLLIAISIYDAIAVWKLKHMITLAKAQAEQKMFAGLLIPYNINEKNVEKVEKNKVINNNKNNPNQKIKKGKNIDIKLPKIEMKIPSGLSVENTRTAILGGGDIAFPMIFSGTVMSWLIENSFTKTQAFFYTLIVVLFSGIGLFTLFLKSEKDKFYPAMPFISFGCFLGFGVLYLLIQFL